MNYLNNEDFKKLFQYAESYQKSSMELRLPSEAKVMPVCVIDNGFQYKEITINEFGEGFIKSFYDKDGNIKSQIKINIDENSVFIKTPKSYDVSVTTKEDIKNKYGEDILNKLTTDYSLQRENLIIQAIEITSEVLIKLNNLGINVDEAKVGNFITDKNTFILADEMNLYVNVTKELILKRASNLIKQHTDSNSKNKP